MEQNRFGRPGPSRLLWRRVLTGVIIRSRSECPGASSCAAPLRTLRGAAVGFALAGVLLFAAPARCLAQDYIGPYDISYGTYDSFGDLTVQFGAEVDGPQFYYQWWGEYNTYEAIAVPAYTDCNCWQQQGYTDYPGWYFWDVGPTGDDYALQYTVYWDVGEPYNVQTMDCGCVYCTSGNPMTSNDGYHIDELSMDIEFTFH